MILIVTLLQINKAINNTIQSALTGTEFKDVEIVTSDFTDGIVRPSLRVTFDNAKSGKFNKNLKERTLTSRVLFYCKDKNKYKLDNLKMQEIIENAFLEDVKITDTFYMSIVSEDGVESDVVDSVLECSFDLYSLEEIIDNTPYENMEDINLKIVEESDNYGNSNA